MLTMGVMSRRLALGGACGVSVSSACVKLLALWGIMRGVDSVPEACYWLKKLSAAIFLLTSMLLFYQAWVVRDGVPTLRVLKRYHPTFVHGVCVGLIVAIINPSDIMGTIAMLGVFVQQGISVKVCVHAIIALSFINFFWALFLGMVAHRHVAFFSRATVKRYALLLGGVVFLIYAVCVI